MSNELLPCPFCGGKATLVPIKGDSSGQCFYVRCNGCPIEIMSIFGAEFAINAWNTRAMPKNEPLTLEQLKQSIGKPIWDLYTQQWYVLDDVYEFDDLTKTLIMKDGTEIDWLVRGDKLYDHEPVRESDTNVN